VVISKIVFGSVSLNDNHLTNTPVSPLSRRERGLDCGDFKNCVRLGITEWQPPDKHPGQSPLPPGEG